MVICKCGWSGSFNQLLNSPPSKKCPACITESWRACENVDTYIIGTLKESLNLLRDKSPRDGYIQYLAERVEIIVGYMENKNGHHA
jgi:hypothetical protein